MLNKWTFTVSFLTRKENKREIAQESGGTWDHRVKWSKSDTGDTISQGFSDMRNLQYQRVKQRRDNRKQEGWLWTGEVRERIKDMLHTHSSSPDETGEHQVVLCLSYHKGLTTWPTEETLIACDSCPSVLSPARMGLLRTRGLEASWHRSTKQSAQEQFTVYFNIYNSFMISLTMERQKSKHGDHMVQVKESSLKKLEGDTKSHRK